MVVMGEEGLWRKSKQALAKSCILQERHHFEVILTLDYRPASKPGSGTGQKYIFTLT